MDHPKFRNGQSNILNFIRQMDIYFRCIDVSREQHRSRILIRQCVCENTRHVLASVCYPKMLDETPYTDLLEMMRRHCLDG